MSAPTPVPALWFQADKVAGAHDSDVAVWVDSQNSVPALGKAYGPAGVFPKIRRDEARPYVRLGTGNNSADNGGYFDLGPRIWALGRTASPEAGHRRGGGGRTSADGVCERQGVGARELAGCFFRTRRRKNGPCAGAGVQLFQQGARVGDHIAKWFSGRMAAAPTASCLSSVRVRPLRWRRPGQRKPVLVVREPNPVSQRQHWPEQCHAGVDGARVPVRLAGSCLLGKQRSPVFEQGVWQTTRRRLRLRRCPLPPP